MNNTLQQLSDELAIRSLADKFSDAGNRKDGEIFRSLWAPDCEWIIGPPVNLNFAGKESMEPSVIHMLDL